jgi:hypothetical protein
MGETLRRRNDIKNKIVWLRISYWAGAIADLYVAFRWLFPQVFPDSSADMGYNLGMKWGVSLMLGWVALLIWADRKPVERKDILLLTIFPVITGLMVTAVVIFTADFISSSTLIFNLVIMAILIGLMGFSYLNAQKI